MKINRRTSVTMTNLLIVMFITLLSLSSCATLNEFAAGNLPKDLVETVASSINSDEPIQSDYSVYDVYIAKAVGDNGLPSHFDLRDKGVVTSVKLQFPFGTCWAFGAAAASETSILTKLGLTNAEFEAKYGYPMDLSERQTAYFVHHALQDSTNPAYFGQNGEGTVFVNQAKNQEMTGGNVIQVGEIFAIGTGPVFDSVVPYQGREGITAMETTSRGSLVHCYSEEDDWSVDESLRLISDFDLLDCSELINPLYFDDNGTYYYNPFGTYDIKCALYKGYGVAISFCADNSMPGRPTTTAFMNTAGDNPPWAHYTYTDEIINHAVCIVGWDDDYPASNFTQGHQPPANGAWIVKNSWGSVNSNEMNYCDWGYEGSGFFYLSYYDQSLGNPTIFDYDVTRFLNGDKATKTTLAEYDFTVPDLIFSINFDEEISYANIFTVQTDGQLQSITLNTADYNSSVAYQIYRLGPDCSNPQDGTLLTSKSVTFEHAGTHRIDLGMAIPFTKGERVAIVIKNVRNEEDDTQTWFLPINSVLNLQGALDENDPTDSESYNSMMYDKAILQSGESFVKFQSSWYDLADIAAAIKTYGEDTLHTDLDNFTIKARFNNN